MGSDATPSPTGRAEPRHTARPRQGVRAHDRRRARPHAGRAAVRDGRPAKLRAGDRRDAAVVRRSRATARSRDRRVRHRATRTRCSGASSGRSTATASSRSATSSASATGSTVSSRATACSCPARSSSRSVGSTTASRCRAAATPTSSCTNGSVRRPVSTVTTILGEGSFHQVHGGTTTNDGGRDDRRSKVFSYGEHYRERRGRTLRGPVKAIHYVGAMSAQGSWRTRARRMSAESFTGAPVSTRAGRDPGEARAPARGAQDLVHRGVLEQPRLAAHDLARTTGARRHRPTSSRTRN